LWNVKLSVPDSTPLVCAAKSVIRLAKFIQYKKPTGSGGFVVIFEWQEVQFCGILWSCANADSVWACH